MFTGFKITSKNFFIILFLGIYEFLTLKLKAKKKGVKPFANLFYLVVPLLYFTRHNLVNYSPAQDETYWAHHNI
jgi:hypothetical protein